MTTYILILYMIGLSPNNIFSMEKIEGFRSKADCEFVGQQFDRRVLGDDVRKHLCLERPNTPETW